eukprot:3881-Heterococcus_DN1.PRE.1
MPITPSTTMTVDAAALLPAVVVILAIAVATKLFIKHQQELKKVLELGAIYCTMCLAELPRPPALPLLGHNVALARHGFSQVPALLQQWSEQYGDAFIIKLNTLWLVLSDPKDIKHIMCVLSVTSNCSLARAALTLQIIYARPHRIYCTHAQAVLDARPGTNNRGSKLCSLFIQSGFDGVVAQNGETWKRHSRITSSAFRYAYAAATVPYTCYIALQLCIAQHMTQRTQCDGYKSALT